MPFPTSAKPRKTILSTSSVIALLGILILANALLSSVNLRLDVTEGRIFSLSPGTRHILSKLEKPVTIRFYCSRSHPDFPVPLKLFAKRVWEFLLEYQYAGGDKIVIERLDPRPDSEVEGWAQRYDLAGMKTETGEAVYCGLVFFQADLEENIDWLDPSRENTLEYDISRKIARVKQPDKKNVGVISHLPVFGATARSTRMDMGDAGGMGMRPDQPAGRPWRFISELGKTHAVQKIPLSADQIGPEIDLLLIIHPKDMHPDLRFAVDQYVLNGGNAIVLADPKCLSDSGGRNTGMIAGTGRSTRALFDAWGIRLDTSTLVVDFDRSGRNGAQSPMDLTVRGHALNRENPVTSSLQSMRFPLAGSIVPAPGSSAVFEPLVQSGPNAAVVDAGLAGADRETIKKQFVSGGTPLNLAVRITGMFKTAFPEGPPASKAVGNRPTRLMESRQQATLIFVADADMLADHYFLQRPNYWGHQQPGVVNDNLNFIVNACEILTGSDALISLRARGNTERLFTRVLDLEEKTRMRWMEKEKQLLLLHEKIHHRLRELEIQKGASQAFGPTPAQQAEIDGIKTDRARIDRELKELRKNLRADVENLGIALKALNIFLMPCLVAGMGMGFAIYRQRKMKNR